MTYREYVINQIEEAENKWREAMQEERWDDAYAYSKSAADLDRIFCHYEYHVGW